MYFSVDCRRWLVICTAIVHFRRLLTLMHFNVDCRRCARWLVRSTAIVHFRQLLTLMYFNVDCRCWLVRSTAIVHFHQLLTPMYFNVDCRRWLVRSTAIVHFYQLSTLMYFSVDCRRWLVRSTAIVHFYQLSTLIYFNVDCRRWLVRSTVIVHFHQLLTLMYSRLWGILCCFMTSTSDSSTSGIKRTPMRCRRCTFCSLSVLYWSISKTRLSVSHVFFCCIAVNWPALTFLCVLYQFSETTRCNRLEAGLMLSLDSPTKKT